MTREELKQFATSIARGERVDINTFSRLTPEEDALACKFIAEESKKFLAEMEEETLRIKNERLKEKARWNRYCIEEAAVRGGYFHTTTEKLLLN